MLIKLSIYIALLCCAGCTSSNSDSDQQAQPAAQQTVESTSVAQQAAPAVIEADLKPSTLFLDNVAVKKNDPLLEQAPSRLNSTGQVVTEKKVKVGTGILTDKNAENWQKSVEGAEIKLDVKLQ
ncbi:MAG: hypothetical protein RBR22_07590 [Desulfuromonas sp.]|nr:hypothetical protein [Desulfuromonas sp.]